MSNLTIYEPAMCCDTGLCGVGVDAELLRISSVVGTLANLGYTINRYNLTSAPMEFVNNKAINEAIKEDENALPITVLDGEIVKVGAYPSNEEVLNYLGINLAELMAQMSGGSGGCGCGSSGCC